MRILLHVGPFGLAESAVKRLRDACGDMEVVATHDATPLEQLSDTQFDVLVAEEMPHDLENWPRLRFVQLVSAGINHLEGHPVWQTNILVANASGTHSVPIAQYVTCAVLMLAHHVPRSIDPTIVRLWQREELENTLVRGQTVGILGYGSIGRECGRQLNALGMRVMCVKRDPSNRRDDGYTAWPGTGDPDGVIPDHWFGPSGLHGMLPLCDAVVVTTPFTAATVHLIGPAELALMKKSAVLINVARGGIVEEAALAHAVRDGQIAGACVDCFTKEPIPSDHVLFDVTGIILTPHIAGVSREFWSVMAALVEQNIHRFCQGQPVLNRVNAKLGY